MIDANGYFDWMIQDPGPLSKTTWGVNTCKMVVPHSAEGYWPYLQTLLHSLDRRASWMFSNLKDGRCFQHYSIYAQVWGSGSGYPNNNGVMWENEGVAGEPLTDEQNDNNIRIIREVSELNGWELSRPTSPTDTTATGYEHSECVRWGSEYTACPSGRIPWDLYLRALEEDEMAERVWCFDRQQTWIIGKFGAAPVLTPDMDAPFVALYGPHTRALTGAQLDAMKPK